MAIDDYAYVGVEFKGYVDMILLYGEDFDDDLGMFSEYISFFVIFEIFDVVGFLMYSICHYPRCRKGSSTCYVFISLTWA